MACEIETYTSFGTFYNQLLADIGAARRHVHLQFFKYEPDSVGQQLGAALMRKAEEGVEVRLMYDALVCSSWRWYYRHLRSHGVQAAPFAPLHKPLPLPVDYYRNHRKVLVIDNHIAYMGGMNIAERYLHGLDWGCWRDTMIRLEGPAALQLQASFIDDWQRCTGQSLPLLPTPSPSPHPCLRLLTSDPTRHDYSIMRHTVQLLDRAERYVWFESPYFIPTPEVMQAMCRAAKRGVDVRVLQPPRGDRGVVCQGASRHHYGKALDAGVRIGIYRPGFMHSKTIVSDDREAVVTSCNIDPRSYRLCHEVAAVVLSPAYAARLRDIFLADEAQSSYIDPAAWPSRPVAARIIESLCNIFSSQL